MFVISQNIVCGSGSVKPKKLVKKFRKFGERLSRERRIDLDRYADRIKEIARDEERRTKELLQQHREFFEEAPRKNASSSSSSSIDFFEK